LCSLPSSGIDLFFTQTVSHRVPRSHSRESKRYQGTRDVITLNVPQIFAATLSRSAHIFCRDASSPLNSKRFSLCIDNFFQKQHAKCLPCEFIRLSRLPKIKNDIHFFLDFDFQPLYTFINCGFSLKTAYP
jgi:hypothetical protein